MAESLMLASDFTEIKDPKAVVEDGWWIQPKIDGIRMLIVVGTSSIVYLSRAMKDITKYVGPKFDPIIKQTKIRNVVLDGELFNQSWSKTAQLRRNIADESLFATTTFQVFDAFPVDNLMKKKTYKTPYKERYEMITHLLLPIKDKKVIVQVPTVKNVKSLDLIAKMCDMMVKKGFEGIMIKDPESPYEFKRTKTWLKVKPFKTLDLRCIGITESAKKPGYMGAIIVTYRDVITYVGSGFTLEQRKMIFEQPKLVVGKICEVKFQEVTKDNRLRFPIFVTIRDDKVKAD